MTEGEPRQAQSGFWIGISDDRQEQLYRALTLTSSRPSANDSDLPNSTRPRRGAIRSKAKGTVRRLRRFLAIAVILWRRRFSGTRLPLFWMLWATLGPILPLVAVAVILIKGGVAAEGLIAVAAAGTVFARMSKMCLRAPEVSAKVFPKEAHVGAGAVAVSTAVVSFIEYIPLGLLFSVFTGLASASIQTALLWAASWIAMLFIIISTTLGLTPIGWWSYERAFDTKFVVRVGGSVVPTLMILLLGLNSQTLFLFISWIPIIGFATFVAAVQGAIGAEFAVVAFCIGPLTLLVSFRRLRTYATQMTSGSSYEDDEVF